MSDKEMKALLIGAVTLLVLGFLGVFVIFNRVLNTPDEKRQRLQYGKPTPVQDQGEGTLNFKDHMTISLRIQELTKDGIRLSDIPELRRLAAKIYTSEVMQDLINPLFDALQKKPRIT